MPAHGGFLSGPVINVVYSADEANANLFTKAGSPAGAVTVNCTINSGVRLYSTDTTLPAFLIQGFAGGSQINLTNLGKVHGMGGRGGAGGSASGGSGITGHPGGTAIELYANIMIANASGEIFGGGQGGDGGDAGTTGGGGGGGGGQGAANANGGAGGSGLTPGTGGATGNESGPGNGGNGGGGGAHAGRDGKAWGAGSPQSFAISLHGFTANITSGNDSTHIKGAVS